MKLRNKVGAVLLLCIMVLTCPAVYGDWDGGADASCSLSIHFQHLQEGVAGAQFRLYRVADVNARQEYTTVYPFEDVKGNDLIEMPLGLRDRAERSGAPADYTLVTDEKGYAGLEGLAPGAWLLVGDPTKSGDGIHYVDPQLIFMPRKNQAGEELYHIDIYPKSLMLASHIGLTGRRVMKIWDDQGYENSRPVSITVRLLKDGQVMDRVELTRENNWEYSWSDLIPTAKWTVEEEVPQGYTAEVQEDEGVFSVTNHRKDVPQTGHIWWPVALLLAGGFLLVVLGILIGRSDRREA